MRISDVDLYGLRSLMGTVVAKKSPCRKSFQNEHPAVHGPHMTPLEVSGELKKQVLKYLALEASQGSVLSGIQSVAL